MPTCSLSNNKAKVANQIGTKPASELLFQFGSGQSAKGPDSELLSPSTSAKHLIQEWEVDLHGSKLQLELKVNWNPGLSKRDRQMLALPTHKRGKVNEVLWAIEDLIGPCSSWPDQERQFFWMKKLSDVNSLRLTTFCIGNGLPPHLLFQWLRVRGVGFDTNKCFNHLKNTRKGMEAMEVGPKSLFFFDLVMGEHCFMNGLPRNNLTMSVKDPKDQLSNQNKKLNEPLCCCGEKMSKHGNYCSNGCDYAAPMEKDDQIDMAISSGCECLHKKLIKKRRNERKR